MYLRTHRIAKPRPNKAAKMPRTATTVVPSIVEIFANKVENTALAEATSNIALLSFLNSRVSDTGQAGVSYHAALDRRRINLFLRYGGRRERRVDTASLNARPPYRNYKSVHDINITQTKLITKAIDTKTIKKFNASVVVIVLNAIPFVLVKRKPSSSKRA